jgi:hypothetical protein
MYCASLDMEKLASQSPLDIGVRSVLAGVSLNRSQHFWVHLHRRVFIPLFLRSSALLHPQPHVPYRQSHKISLDKSRTHNRLSSAIMFGLLTLINPLLYLWAHSLHTGTSFPLPRPNLESIYAFIHAHPDTILPLVFIVVTAHAVDVCYWLYKSQQKLDEIQ